jgi:hypothetical protein
MIHPYSRKESKTGLLSKERKNITLGSSRLPVLGAVCPEKVLGVFCSGSGELFFSF